MATPRLASTPNSRIRQALRILWLRSRERSQALKNTGYTCSVCGVHQSAAKGREVRLDVHHTHKITNWDRMFAVIREELLVGPEHLAPLCSECHRKLEGKRGPEGGKT